MNLESFQWITWYLPMPPNNPNFTGIGFFFYRRHLKTFVYCSVADPWPFWGGSGSGSYWWTRIWIQEAHKHVDLVDPDPQWFIGYGYVQFFTMTVFLHLYDDLWWRSLRSQNFVSFAKKKDGNSGRVPELTSEFKKIWFLSSNWMWAPQKYGIRVREKLIIKKLCHHFFEILKT
jgi:hypothetical protein